MGRLVEPFQQFFQAESSSGIVLLISAVVALGWANSPWRESYFHLWEVEVVVGGGPLRLAESLHHWINDGLMAFFFFLVGLEIKREVLVGELASMRRAALPIAAAVGGMVVPAVIFAGFNAGTPELRGWGIPMATDIAFALGVLALLGDRVPTGLKVFLAALAIADDLGAVLVIAVFYSDGVEWAALGWALAIFIILIGANRGGIRRASLYAGLGLVMWLFFLRSGVHATVAGVLLAATIPARTRINVDQFVARAGQYLTAFGNAGTRPEGRLSETQELALEGLEEAAEDVQSPLMNMEHALVPWVAYGIVPIFALANAGVTLDGAVLEQVASPLVLGIALGLILGKPLGIGACAWVATRMGWAELPEGVDGRQVAGAGLLAGIGFTMSLFIADLAFGGAVELELAKVGVLGASVVAGVAGWVMLARSLPSARDKAGAEM